MAEMINVGTAADASVAATSAAGAFSSAALSARTKQMNMARIIKQVKNFILVNSIQFNLQKVYFY